MLATSLVLVLFSLAGSGALEENIGGRTDPYLHHAGSIMNIRDDLYIKDSRATTEMWYEQLEEDDSSDTTNSLAKTPPARHSAPRQSSHLPIPSSRQKTGGEELSRPEAIAFTYVSHQDVEKTSVLERLRGKEKYVKSQQRTCVVMIHISFCNPKKACYFHPKSETDCKGITGREINYFCPCEEDAPELASARSIKHEPHSINGQVWGIRISSLLARAEDMKASNGKRNGFGIYFYSTRNAPTSKAQYRDKILKAETVQADVKSGVADFALTNEQIWKAFTKRSSTSPKDQEFNLQRPF